MDDQVKLKLLTEKSEMLKAMAHPMRLCILNCLLSSQDCNVTTLTKKLSQPQSTISQHISKLKAHGLIEGQRNGVEIQYRVIDDEVKSIIDLLLKELHKDAVDGSINEDALNC